MERYFDRSGRHPLLLCMIALIATLILIGCYRQETSSIVVHAAMPLKPSTLATHAATSPALATHEATSPARGATGRILIQLFQAPGFIYPSINGVPEWTLYENGLLIFKSGTNAGLLQAHLSTSSVRSILSVILQQNAFFASTRGFYGRLIPDVGSLLLRVHVNGQYKEVNLYGEPVSPVDEQTKHIFAIRNFLLSYHPAVTQSYMPPGIALLAILQGGDSTGVPIWPDKSISLASIAALECPYLSYGCPADQGSKTGIMTVCGSHGRMLLQQTSGDSYARVKEQGKIYRLIVWPLLPDALYPRADGLPGIEVQGAKSGIWPFLHMTCL